LHLELLTQGLGIWAYLLLAVLVMVEGPVATLAGAVAAASGFMNPEGVFIAAATGNLISDCLWYSLGYLGKMEWLEKYGRWVHLTPAVVYRFRRDIEKHASKLLFISKITLGFSIPTLIATGLAKVPFKRWFPWLALGETLWTGSLTLLGYHLGMYVQRLERGVEMAAIAGGLLSAAFIIFYIAKMRQGGFSKKNNLPSNESGFSSSNS
jgi:membrane protein DedA with SNARE-associated domain